MNINKRRAILSILKNIYPNPLIELKYKSNFELLVSIMLSAKTTDKSVNKVTKKMFLVANTPELIIKLGVNNLENYIKYVGLYKSKARNIIATSNILIKKYNNEIPKSRKNLESLPGVGRKTANIIMNIIFGKLTIAVDTHVFRVSNRTKIACGKNVRIVESCLKKMVPIEFHYNTHKWLILHGKNTCKSRYPRCFECQIVSLCEFEYKNN